MPQLFSALRVLGRHTVMKSALDTRFVPVSFEDAGDENRMQIPDVLRTSVTAIRGRDGIGHAVLSNLYNVIHGATHVLAQGDTSSSFRASGARLFRLAWPAARNRSRHCEARAAVIPTARDTDSRSSPRNRRSTTSRFRPTDNRPPRPGPAASPVALRAPSAAADP